MSAFFSGGHTKLEYKQRVQLCLDMEVDSKLTLNSRRLMAMDNPFVASAAIQRQTKVPSQANAVFESNLGKG